MGSPVCTGKPWEEKPDLGITMETGQTLGRVLGPGVVLGELKSSSVKNETVDERERRIHPDYQRSARKLDDKHYPQALQARSPRH